MTGAPRVVTPPGRSAEVDAIVPVLDAVAAGTGGVLLVAGEGGVGKTTLGEWVAEEARARGATVLDAQSFALSVETPYASLIAAFGTVLRDPSVDVAALTNGLASLGLLFDGITDQPVPTAPEFARSRLHGAFATLVSRMSQHAPLVLLIDDLQWIDTASLEVLHALVNDLPHVPLLFVATLRPYETNERPQTKRLLHTLRAKPWVTTIDVSGLDRDAIGVLLQHRLGSVVPSRLIDVVHERSAGTPLVAEELVSMMIETGALRPVGRRWEFMDVDDLPLVDVADDLIGDRLERLGPASIGLVATVSIAGAPVTTDDVAAVARDDAASIGPRLEELRRLGLLDRTDLGGDVAWLPHHPIIGEVAVSLVGEALVGATHRRYAEILPPSAVDRRGRHVLRAGAAAREAEHLAVLIDAGVSAADRGAPQETCRLVGAALDAIDNTGVGRDRLPEVLRLLGEAWNRRNEGAVAYAHLSRARDLADRRGDVEESASLLIGIHVASWVDRVDRIDFEAECDALVDRLIAEGRHDVAHRLLCSEVMRHMRLVGTVGERLRQLTDIERKTTDPMAPRWREVLERLDSRWFSEPVEPAIATVEGSLAAAPDDEALTRRLLHEQLDYTLAAGGRDDVRRVVRREHEFFDSLGEPASWRIGMASWDQAIGDGDLRGADEIRHIESLARNDRPIGYLSFAFAVNELLRGDGRFTDFALTRPHPDWIAEAGLRIAGLLRAETADERRDFGTACIEVWEQRRWLPGIPLMPVYAGGLGYLAVGDHDGLQALCHDLERFDGGTGRTSAWAALFRGHAAVEDAIAVDHFSDAANRFAALGRPFDAAMCRLELLERGANVPADVAADMATRFDAAPAPWLIDRLTAAGVELPDNGGETTADHLDLTAREREVAEVVAEGLSNKEVANRLFISVRTVTSHLDHIYSKLGISSRTELVDLIEDRT